MYRHLGHARHVIKRVPQELHVIAVVFNPLRFVSRYNLYKEFAERVEASGAILWTVELALGDRPFEVTSDTCPRHIQYRTKQELWHKERMINAAVARLPSDWQYVAWVDADVSFVNHDWVPETIQQLQHYQVVQLFSHAIDVGPNGEPIEQFEGFAYSHILGRPFMRMNKPKGVRDYYGGRYWHPGYAWAYRREAWDKLGGLLDINIVGGGDHMMAYSLIGRVEETIPAGSTPGYAQAVQVWGDNADRTIERDIGAVPGTLMHHFHGPKVNRGYYNRWRILTDNDFDPRFDLKNDWQGMLALTGRKIGLRDDLRAYFRARNEDSIG